MDAPKFVSLIFPVDTRPLDVKSKQSLQCMTFKANECGIAYLNYHRNMILIEELVRLDRLVIPCHIDEIRKDPLLAESLAGKIDDIECGYMDVNQYRYRYTTSIKAVEFVVAVMIHIKYRHDDEFRLLGDSWMVIDSFIPLALAKCFGFSYKGYLNCYASCYRTDDHRAMYPPLLEAY